MAIPESSDTPQNQDSTFALIPPVFATPQSPPEPDRPFSYWVKKLLVCNPFYLVSAAVLLYGFYLVSMDADFPGKELAGLAFNFGSLQFYEILLVVTAVFLARRSIWYDSNLLIFLENLLVLVPFILISQAALLYPGVVWTVCLVAGAMTLLRFGGLKCFYTKLNLPRGLLMSGLLLLLVNVVLPLIFRQLHESKVGTKPTEGAAFQMNQFSWFLILPGIIALANCLPKPAQAGELLPQRRWLPTGFFSLWAAGSAVHLYCLCYVYNFDWETCFLLAPLWVFAWTLYRRHGDFFPAPKLHQALLIPPLVITLLPANKTVPFMFLALTSLNILAYASLFLKQRSNRLALHLAILSSATLALGGVKHFEPQLPPDLTTTNCLIAFITAYISYWIVISRQPKLAILGAIIVGSGIGTFLDRYALAPNIAIQCTFLFLLLHSLLWQDAAHPGARGARIFASVLWLLHSFFLVSMSWPHSWAIISTAAAIVLSTCAMLKLIQGQWPPLTLPITAGIILLLHPATHTAIKAQSTPIGPWVVAGSFLLFAIGTALALTKSKWNRPAPQLSPAVTPNTPTH